MNDDPWTLQYAIEIVCIGAGKAGYRHYAGSGAFYAGDNDSGPAEAVFIDWGLARATAIILNAVVKGQLQECTNG